MKSFMFILLPFLGLTVHAQDSMEKVMERRARELHRTIGLPNKEDWMKFVKENYAQSLIDRPMKTRIDGPSGKTENKVEDNIEGKALMLGRLREEFGSSKVVSIKTDGEVATMVLDNGDGLLGTFKLKFVKSPPYLIEGLGIEVGN
jgi:hypothetical protein